MLHLVTVKGVEQGLVAIMVAKVVAQVVEPVLVAKVAKVADSVVVEAVDSVAFQLPNRPPRPWPEKKTS